MKVEILTPKKIEFEEEAVAIILPTLLGEISVLPHHLSLVSVLKPGTIRVRTKTKETAFEIEGGILEMDREKAFILLKKF